MYNVVMPNIQSAKKRMRQNEKQRIHNRMYSSTLRTYVKKVNTLLDKGEYEAIPEAFRKLTSIVDKTSKKDIIHANKASRIKSRIALAINRAIKSQDSKDIDDVGS